MSADISVNTSISKPENVWMYTYSPCRLFAYIYINNAQQTVSRDRLM